jgi:hypothetical protein
VRSATSSKGALRDQIQRCECVSENTFGAGRKLMRLMKDFICLESNATRGGSFHCSMPALYTGGRCGPGLQWVPGYSTNRERKIKTFPVSSPSRPRFPSPADADGNWIWSTPGRNGDAARESVFSFNTDGSQLTGKISTRGRDGKPVGGNPNNKQSTK